jgi:hypothetical protein
MQLRPRAIRETEKPEAPLQVVRVTWAKHPNAGELVAQFKIVIDVFFVEGDYNYSNWKYQQQAYDQTVIRAGLGAGHRDTTTWAKDEPYTAEWSETDKRFAWRFIDQPGYSRTKGLAADSDIDYKFAAKWRVWNEKTGEDLQLGPYYAQITGAHPRKYFPDDMAFLIKQGNVTLTWLNGLEKAKPEGCPW